MKFFRVRISRIATQLAIVLICVASEGPVAEADLHWKEAKKEMIRIRLVAIAESDPRSSFFSTHEIFVAAQQLKGENEFRLVKLVYAFLPYQTRLSEYGFDYSLVYEIRATRDMSCDQSLSQMTTDQRNRQRLELKYSTDSPDIEANRRHSQLPCYSSTPEDYARVVHEPPNAGSEF